MSLSLPKYRQSLNSAQLEILQLLLNFRFINSNSAAKYFDQPNGSHAVKRLRILTEQSLIARRYDSSYRLAGQGATYSLQPKGLTVLLDQPGFKLTPYLPKIRAGLYANRRASSRTIAAHLDLLNIYLALKVAYGEKLGFFTKNQLLAYDYFPRPWPFAYFYVDQPNPTKQHLMLELLHDPLPSFVISKCLTKYIDYHYSGTWQATNSAFPEVLLICSSTALCTRARRQLDHSWTDLPKFQVLTIDQAKDPAFWLKRTSTT